MLPPLLKVIGAVAVLTFATANAASLATGTGRTVELNGIHYYVPPKVVSTIDLAVVEIEKASVCSVEPDLIPFTVFSDNSTTFGSGEFTSLVNRYAEIDDVFSHGFLTTVLLQFTGTGKATVSNDTDSVLMKYGTSLLLLTQAYGGAKCVDSVLPYGPYFMEKSSGDIHEAWRLYSDVQGAFTEGLIAVEDGNYSVLPAAIPGNQSPTIGVPSKLYYTKTAEKPLAGVRLGVKDIYDIAGVKTSCGNRAYYELYPERNATAVAVQKLIDAGAVVIGKMKTSQFANGETATADWVDYHSPFNARGDGYQDPSSSSSGPGAGVGAYEWMDIGLGSDTGGSIRNPSQVNGCYGNRPSWGISNLTGVMPLSPVLDTAGFLVRDPLLWSAASRVLYAETLSFNYTTFPKKIYTYNFPTNATTEAEEILLDFTAKLAEFIGGSTTPLDYNLLWNQTGPRPNTTLNEVVGAGYRTLITQQQHRLLAKPFYDDYAVANNGRKPFIDPAPLVRWNFGQRNISLNLESEALANKTAFGDWWRSNVLVGGQPQTCSDSLMLYAGTLGTPYYRNTYLNPPTPPGPTFSVSRVSNFAEVPDMVFPIGQAAYNSTITGQTEYLPVAVDILAAKGCDGMIFELAEQLYAAGILKKPMTGTVMF